MSHNIQSVFGSLPTRVCNLRHENGMDQCTGQMCSMSNLLKYLKYLKSVLDINFLKEVVVAPCYII